MSEEKKQVSKADFRGNGVFDKMCKFPFIFNEVEYNQCTTITESKPWCSLETTAAKQHVTGKFGFCIDNSADFQGNGVFDRECIFPFIYQGVEYNQCTTIGEPRPWCSLETTAENVHVTGNFGFCRDKSQQEIQFSGTNKVRTADFRGNGVFNMTCKFPFIYERVVYRQCTWVGESKPWCSVETTAAKEHVAGKWGYCNENDK